MILGCLCPGVKRELKIRLETMYTRHLWYVIGHLNLRLSISSRGESPSLMSEECYTGCQHLGVESGREAGIF